MFSFSVFLNQIVGRDRFIVCFSGAGMSKELYAAFTSAFQHLDLGPESSDVPPTPDAPPAASTAVPASLVPVVPEAQALDSSLETHSAPPRPKQVRKRRRGHKRSKRH